MHIHCGGLLVCMQNHGRIVLQFTLTAKLLLIHLETGDLAIPSNTSHYLEYYLYVSVEQSFRCFRTMQQHQEIIFLSLSIKAKQNNNYVPSCSRHGSVSGCIILLQPPVLTLVHQCTSRRDDVGLEGL